MATKDSPYPTVALLGRAGDTRVDEAMRALALHLCARQRHVVASIGLAPGFFAAPVEYVEESSLATASDLLVAIGGDGTMLLAARLAAVAGVPILGINRGRLGFLADVSPEQMLDRVDDALVGRCVAERRLLLEASLQRRGEILSCLALNDVVVARRETGRMLELQSWVDGNFVNTHGGDGFIVATSTGSTAYALSCGGPIIHPTLGAFVLAPICPHTLSDRPIVVGADCVVELELVERNETRAQIVCDGVLLSEIEPGDRLRVARAGVAVTLLHPPGHDYYRTLRSKLNWGRNLRQGSEPPA